MCSFEIEIELVCWKDVVVYHGVTSSFETKGSVHWPNRWVFQEHNTKPNKTQQHTQHILRNTLPKAQQSQTSHCLNFWATYTSSSTSKSPKASAYKHNCAGSACATSLDNTMQWIYCTIECLLVRPFFMLLLTELEQLFCPFFILPYQNWNNFFHTSLTELDLRLMFLSVALMAAFASETARWEELGKNLMMKMKKYIEI